MYYVICRKPRILARNSQLDRMQDCHQYSVFSNRKLLCRLESATDRSSKSPAWLSGATCSAVRSISPLSNPSRTWKSGLFLHRAAAVGRIYGLRPLSSAPATDQHCDTSAWWP